jgi:cyclophilin family peptidyl-prolyl cis-trans isomerase
MEGSMLRHRTRVACALLLPLLLPLGSGAARAADEKPQGGSTVVILETSQGNIEIELDAKSAPVTVENFLAYVDAGHYDGTIFHRVIPGFMIQGGGFDAAMSQKPTRAPIKNEADNGLGNARGTIAMARTNDPNSATAQFFINTVDNANLNRNPSSAGYAVFGKVTAGMDVVDKIEKVPTTSKGGHRDVPSEAVTITKARRK